MNCPFCGTAHPEPAISCRRCASTLPESRCLSCKVSVPWENSYCDRCRPESDEQAESCPACNVANDPEADYCKSCGSPMAVITRIVKASNGEEYRDPWRVYGVETTLVGRDDELTLLHDTLNEVERSHSSRLALISGAEGLGKSRVLAEFERRLESAFCTAVILRGVCREEVGGAFAVIARILKRHFYIADQGSPERAQQNLFDAVQLLVGEQAEQLCRHLGDLMGLTPSVGLDESSLPSPRQQEIAAFKAVETVLRADAANNPLLFLLDDVHLAPDPTVRLLIHLIENLKDAPVFFVLTQLEGARRVIPPRTAHLELSLAPLSDAEVREHVRATLRLARSIEPQLLESVVDAAVGNPLVAEEILRIFIAEGVIDTRIEPWEIDARRIKEINIPTSMQATIEARLKGLSAEERQALEMAACVGNIFWANLLRCLESVRQNAAGELDEPWMAEEPRRRPPIDDVLESLERKDMVRRQQESRLQDEEEFAFKHRLEREALYESIPPRVRERYHRFIAQWVERAVDDDTDGAAEFIARHYVRARCLRRAAQKFLVAGDDARRHHANKKAVRLYEEALGCLTDADMELKLRAFHDLGSVYELFGEHDQAMTYYHDMARYAWLLGDRAKGGAALNKLGRAYRGLGEYDESLKYFRRALTLFRQANDERGVASTLDDVGKIYWIRGIQDEALKYYTAALEMRRGLGDERSIALSLGHLGSLKMQRGELRQAVKCFKEALELAKACGDQPGTADSYNNLGALCVEQGKFDKALPLFDQALQTARAVGFRSLEAAILNNRGEALMNMKRRDEARAHLTESRDLAIQLGNQRVIFDTLRNLARLAVREADRDLALERIGDALEIARQLDSKTLIALGELTRAEIHAEYIFDSALKEKSLREATNSFRQALLLLRETGNEVQLAHALSSFGNFLVESGDVESGRQHLQEAVSIFERFTMSKYLENTARTLARLTAADA